MRLKALRTALRLVTLAAVLPASGAWAHAVLLQPKPRTNIAEKLAPCGNSTRRGDPTTLPSGGKLTVSWTETVDHPGYYQLWFSPANDADFVLLADQIPNPDGKQDGSREIALPDLECAACTLRLIQVMTENPARPTHYYSCADISLSRGNTPNPTPDAGSPGDPAGSEGGDPEQDMTSVQGADDVRAGCGAVEGALSSGVAMLTALFWTAAGIRLRRR